YLLGTTSKGISSIQLSKHIGVTQKTAWFMAHRLRSAKKQSDDKLSGVIEADETYIGGKARNMHAKRRRELFQGRDRGTVNKVPVLGMKTREGKIRATVIKEVSSLEIHPAIKSNVAEGSTLYSDEHRAYNNLGRLFKRGIVRHGLGEYVKGEIFTNGIESFWAILKRGYHGVYHWMSKKHLQHYVNEFVFRFNNRLAKTSEVFSEIIDRVIENQQLPYKTLIQKL
ncbi:MAG: IS1595 family transposase, partial [Verrucomicrobiota bacterium]